MKTKKANSELNPANMLKMWGYSAAAGASTATALALLNALRRARERKKEEEESSKNVLVVEIPEDRMGSKTAAMLGIPSKEPKIEGTETITISKPLTFKRQQRSIDGKFGSKIAQDITQDPGFLEQTGTISGALIGTPLAFYGGFKAITALYNKLKEKRMAEKAKLYKDKYMRATLEGSMKLAADASPTARILASMSKLLGNVGTVYGSVAGAGATMANQIAQIAADSARFGKEHKLDLGPTLAAGGLAMGTLGFGASAYATKKLLDAKFSDPETPLNSIRRRKRIIFRSVPKPQPENTLTALEQTEQDNAPLNDNSSPIVDYQKTSSDGSHKHYMAMLSTEILKQAGQENILLEPVMKVACAIAGYDCDDLYNLVKEGSDITEAAILESPSIQTALMTRVFGSDPCLNKLYKLSQIVPDPNQETMADALAEAAVRLQNRDSLPTDTQLPEMGNDDYQVFAETPQVAAFLRKHKKSVGHKLQVAKPSKVKDKKPKKEEKD
jgi:hypothetical protein